MLRSKDGENLEGVVDSTVTGGTDPSLWQRAESNGKGQEASQERADQIYDQVAHGVVCKTHRDGGEMATVAKAALTGGNVLKGGRGGGGASEAE